MLKDVPPPKLKSEKLRQKTKATKHVLLKRAQAKEAKEIYRKENAIRKNLADIRVKKARLTRETHLTNGKQIASRIVLDDEEIAPVLKDTQEIIFKPNEGPQTDFLASSEQEVFYGGARGGGKSYSLLVDPLRYCTFAAHRALIIRRTMPELRDLINHAHQLYPKAFPKAQWREKEATYKFPSGARIEFGYAENEQDALRYQGQAYTWIGIDELPQYSGPKILNDLRGSLRSVDPRIPTYLRATGNPGNIGSGWVKTEFIDPAPPNTPFKVAIDMPDGSTEYITRRFIPAKLTDNPKLMQTKTYQIMLASLPEIQRKQWLEGNWDVYDGVAFPEFDKEIHVVRDYSIPSGWMRFRSCDWGYSSPACCLWFACDYDGNLVVYRELYVKGMTADQFAYKVLDLEAKENVKYGILDSSTWSKRGDTGPSIAEAMIKVGCRWRPSDRSPNSRNSGKIELHRRLAIDPNTGKPKLQFMESCRNIIRTLPILPLDKNDIEDVDTKAEDHAYDAARYGCSSRPITVSSFETLMRNAKERYAPADKTFGY